MKMPEKGPWKRSPTDAITDALNRRDAGRLREVLEALSPIQVAYLVLRDFSRLRDDILDLLEK